MIYYFDDAKDGVRERFDTRYLETGEYDDTLRHFETVPSDLDSLFIGDAEVVIFYHDSMPGADRVGDWIDDNPSVAYIQFSDGIDFGEEYTPADDEYADSWTLKKKLFYEHLGGFLWAYKNGVRSLKDFLKYEMPAATEMPTATENSWYVFDSEYPDISIPWETEVFVRKEIAGKTKVIFDLDALSSEFVAYMATYIRLSIHAIGKGALASFVFVGENSFDHYLSEYRKTQSHEALLWVGSMFVEKKGRSMDEIIASGVPGDKLTSQSYINDFLRNLKVSPNAEVGNHSIANYWGAYVIARHIAGFEQKAQKIYMKALEKDALYLKYLMVDRIRKVGDINNILNGSAANVKFVNPLELKWNPKVLLIDDQDDIWKDVVQALLPKAKLTVIGKSNDLINSYRESKFLTEEAKSIIYNDRFDLILLDLRLGGVLEESIVNGDECSGMKILEDITKRNPGQQVIMFTSSNKAWNLKKALTMAAGYYIKESPLQPFNEDETFNNLKDFLTTIESCLYYFDLKNLVGEIRKYEEIQFPGYLNNARNESERVCNQLRIVESMAISKSKELNSGDWTYIYIALFQVLEIVKRLDEEFNFRENQQLDQLINGVAGNVNGYDLSLHRQMRNILVHKGTKMDMEQRPNRIITDDSLENGEVVASYGSVLELWDLIKDILDGCGVSFDEKNKEK